MNARKARPILVAVAVALGLAVYLRWRGDVPQHGEGARLTQNQTVVSTPVPVISPSPVVSPRAEISPAAGAQAPDRKSRVQAEWLEFKRRYGEGYQAEFDSEGRVRSIRIGSGDRKGVDDFDLKNPQQLVARARKLISDSREMLGLDDNFPLGEPTVRSQDSTAQVSFRQTSGGIPLAPYGKISFDFNIRGQLTGMDSGYLPNVSITNTQRMDESNARAAALRALGGKAEGPFKPEGGNRLLWVVGYQNGRAEAKQAYEYFAGGHQIIIDAETGKAISMRDRRHR